MAADPAEKRRSAQMVTLTGYFAGLPVESVLRVTVRPPHAIEFKQVRGTLRALSGQCTLAAVEDGTEARYRIEADPGIAMITDAAARQFLVQFVERMLDRVRLAAERKAPPRRTDRAGAAVPAGLEAAEEEEAEPVSEIPAEVGAAPPEAAAEEAPISPPAPPPHPGEAAGAASPSERPDAARTGRRRRRRRRRGRPPGAPGQSPAPTR